MSCDNSQEAKDLRLLVLKYHKKLKRINSLNREIITQFNYCKKNIDHCKEAIKAHHYLESKPLTVKTGTSTQITPNMLQAPLSHQIEVPRRADSVYIISEIDNMLYAFSQYEHNLNSIVNMIDEISKNDD